MPDGSGEDRLLDEVAEKLKKVSRGPWRAHPGGEVLGPEGHSIAECWGPECGEDAELIAAAPAWLARLCARVRQLEAEVLEAREDLEEEKGYHTLLDAQMMEAAKIIKTDAAWPLTAWPSPHERIWWLAAKAEITELRAASPRLTEALAEIATDYMGSAVGKRAEKVLAALRGAGAPPEGEK